MTNKITKSKLQISKSKAFTLMEVLIAAVIFAAVMMMATGVFGQSSIYRTKIKTMRETAEETKRLADLITREVKSANNPATFSAIDTGNEPIENLSKSGVGLFYCHAPGTNTKCYFKFNESPYSSNGESHQHGNGASLLANMLVISKKDGYVAYLSDSNQYLSDSNQVYFKSYSASTIINAALVYEDLKNSENVISSKNTDTYIYFAGDTASSQQDYVQFDVLAKTKSYNSLPVGARASSEIRSAVTSRSFNN